MSRRRTISVLAGVLAVGTAAAAVTVLNLPEAASDDDATGREPAATTEITEQTLVDSESHDGTLGHGDTTTVTARAAGTVTGLPGTGTTVTRGKPVYRLDNRPVILVYGSLPAYRDLHPGVEGADVRQFERNLRALGHDGFTVDDEYTRATAAAVEDWQDDAGLRATGTVTTDQIRYAAGAVRVDSHRVEPGAVVQPGAAILRTTGTAMVATVPLDVDDQRLARRGAAVEVSLPDGATTAGRITAVETVVELGQGNEEDTTRLEVTVAFAEAPRSLDGAAITVAFTAARRAGVLVVPVPALLALAEGGYGLEVVEAGGSRIVAVRTGLFADGKVEISGAGLRAGTKVGMPA